MDAFLTRYYAAVNRYQGDPTTSKRLTKPQKLLDFHDAQREVFEAILRTTGQESMINRTEADFTVEDDRVDYPLPYGYRQFVSCIRYQTKVETKATLAGANYDGTDTVTETDAFADYCFKDGDQLVVTAPTAYAGTYDIASQTDDDVIVLSTDIGDAIADNTLIGTIARTVPDKDLPLTQYYTMPEYGIGPGIVLHSQLDGMQIKPPPSLAEDQLFVMTYLKAPILIHMGIAAGVSANTITFVATVASADDGELVWTNGYYNGCLINIYSATLGVQQVRKVKHSHIIDPTGTKLMRCELVNAWDVTPTGTVLYEIVPLFPVGLDKIYAIDVALANSPRRHNMMWRESLRERAKIWEGCMNYALSGTMDRSPSRNLPMLQPWDDDPYDYMG